ncbi:hypothetical protein HRW16_33810 [Streptomyces lunaelactis]|uniref:hypothetical protein n=1 Tax=Streptomyces lunaelactis TaxID=1535768 RepID=UPI0015845AA0|nr:hypothetical protein [Streptomyces lunaelactis]NUK04154.1 hypothetical protein [Streptomyces lunaelactis]NUK20427.1 hypothetical protein [Streptomyces lunaelactis]NUK38894.1 hypothetical protein [Streptomyces lunaelactis]NUK40638.1 hypothetical protein [Streptomyces lunaelactis]NUK56840.1 hypothetical protein [Streptomyces lunaelactis]
MKLFDGPVVQMPSERAMVLINRRDAEDSAAQRHRTSAAGGFWRAWTHCRFSSRPMAPAVEDAWIRSLSGHQRIGDGLNATFAAAPAGT